VSAPSPASLRPVAVNMLGVVEHPALGNGPYQIDADGHPYLPVGDGGIVLGLQLGDSAFARKADHAAPGACLVHPDPAARHALVTYSCIGNQVKVRTGRAAGARGVVIGKRGEEGRVIVAFRPAELAAMRPSDEVSVRACGQGSRPDGFPAGLAVLNINPGLFAILPTVRPAAAGDGPLSVGVRCSVPRKLVGNGLGRPAVSWDIDLQLPPPGPGGDGDVRLGDLVAVTDIDARFNVGYRRGWVTVGVAVHGSSPLPGHGPGITPMLTGPAGVLEIRHEGASHVGLTAPMLRLQ
jgi:Domain of unknown function (DUF4438), N-terminal/Domain of unknown function (DUF4438), C-terminal